MGWFISPGWSPFFIVGVAIYHIHAFRPNTFNVSILAVSLVLSCIRSYAVTGGFISAPTEIDLFIATSLIVVFAGILLLIATNRLSIRGSRWVVTAGALTYPLYLLHNKAGKALIDGPLTALPEWLAVTITIALGTKFL